MTISQRLAVVLFNLGGPDSLAAVRPFLFNLFNDPAILRVPNPIRKGLAWWISRRRAPVAQEIYDKLGGKSPLLEMTNAQARALEGMLNQRFDGARVFVAMRYWHPMSAETVKSVQAYDPDRIVLLPLYPQFSTTTSRSSFLDWQEAARKVGLSAPTTEICCYPANNGFVEAYARLIGEVLNKMEKDSRVRILFSAHGLPKRIIEGGDPYAWQVEQSVAAIVTRLSVPVDHMICYQSRVGPLEWIGPSTESELERAGKDGVSVIVVPIAFVSEHSETLVELDIDYRDKALAWGVRDYIRIAAVGISKEYILGLADLVAEALKNDQEVIGSGCPTEFKECYCRNQN